MTATLIALAAVTLLAYAVKAATGFGPALVVVSLGSVLVGPVNAVVLAAFLDLVSGAGVLWLDRRRVALERWWGLAASMSAGAVAGSLLLGVIPTAALTRLVAVGIVGFGLWMLLPPRSEGEVISRQPAPGGRSKAGGSTVGGSTRGPPKVAGHAAVQHAVVAAAGVSGGLIGVGGPPLVVYYGSRLARERFRALIVPLLLAAAVFRVVTYGVSGQVDGEVLVLLAVSLPSLPLGLALGNRIFRRWSERSFRMAVALLVMIAGLRLLF